MMCSKISANALLFTEIVRSKLPRSTSRKSSNANSLRLLVQLQHHDPVIVLRHVHYTRSFPTSSPLILCVDVEHVAISLSQQHGIGKGSSGSIFMHRICVPLFGKHVQIWIYIVSFVVVSKQTGTWFYITRVCTSSLSSLASSTSLS